MLGGGSSGRRGWWPSRRGGGLTGCQRILLTGPKEKGSAGPMTVAGGDWWLPGLSTDLLTGPKKKRRSTGPIHLIPENHTLFQYQFPYRLARLCSTHPFDDMSKDSPRSYGESSLFNSYSGRPFQQLPSRVGVVFLECKNDEGHNSGLMTPMVVSGIVPGGTVLVWVKRLVSM